MTNSSETEPRSVAVNSKRVGIAMVAGVALAAAAAGGWLLFIDGDPERSAATTVREFVEAQRAGDCEAILGLLSEESRTDRGRLSQYEFLDLCATATKGVTAEVDSVELLSQVGDRATVGLSVRVAEEKYTHSIDLVAEDGEWRLDTTHGRFRIGRSYPEILHAFFRALENHDCGQMAELQAQDRGRFAGSRRLPGVV